MTKFHNLAQGSDAWHQFRLEHKGASEVAAALGISPTTTRTELLKAKKTGIAKEFSDFVQRRVLDNGHEVEALARPIMEEIIGDELYPVTCSRGDLSASCDGLTMDRLTAFEHKQWSEALAAQVREGIVPEYHLAQCQQILYVTGAERVIFTVSDGTRDNFVHTTVTPDDAWFERIERAWEQFDADLATFEPVEIKERPKAEVTLALPALVIHAKGEITTSNMHEYGVALATRLAEVRAIELVTDQDFSNAKKSAQLLRENIQQAKHAKEAMLAQTVTVGEAASMIDMWCEDMRLTALKLEQDVEREDKAKKAAMVLKSRGEYEKHIDALKADTGGPWITLSTPDWASSLKNKRSFASMQDALDTMLANAKIVADDSARKIRAALACMDEEGKDFEFLLADRLSHIGKPVEDIRTLVRARITEHKAKEAQRLEAQREQIRAEEAAKLQREAEAKAAADRAEAERVERERAHAAQVEAARIAREQAAEQRETQRQAEIAGAALLARQQAEQKEQIAQLTSPSLSTGIGAFDAQIIGVDLASGPDIGTPEDDGNRLTLTQLNERLSPVSINVAGLSALGFDPVEQVKASRFYRECDLPAIARAISAHVLRACAPVEA